MQASFAHGEVVGSAHFTDCNHNFACAHFELLVFDLIDSGTEAYHLIRLPVLWLIEITFAWIQTQHFPKKFTSVKSHEALLIFSFSFAFACGELDFLFPCAYGGG